MWPPACNDFKAHPCCEIYSGDNVGNFIQFSAAEFQRFYSMAMGENLSLEGSAPTGLICPECGHPFDADRCCWVCVARMEDIQQTITFSVIVGFGGMIGTVFTMYSYVPLGSCWWVVYMIAALFVIPAGITFALYNYDRLTRYATRVRVMLAMAAAAVVMLAAYFFLNGFLDGNAPVEAPATVLQKFIDSGRYGDEYYFQLTLSWNGKRYENDDLIVGRNTYSISEPGDSVRVIVHPGKFSLPWYSAVLPSVSRESNSR